MKHRKISSAVVVAATALVATLSPEAASAHGAPFTVTAGAARSGTVVGVTKVSTGTSPQLIFKDTTTNTTLTCASSVIKGTVRTGPTNGNPVVALDGAGVIFNGCTGPAGLQFKVTGYGQWNINILDSINGVSTGTVTNIRAHVQNTAGPRCEFDIGADAGSFTSSGTATVAPGAIAGTYVNSTQNVTLPASNPGTLGIWNFRGGSGGTSPYCVSRSIIAQGDRASFSAVYKLTADTASNNPVAIS